MSTEPQVKPLTSADVLRALERLKSELTADMKADGESPEKIQRVLDGVTKDYVAFAKTKSSNSETPATKAPK